MGTKQRILVVEDEEALVVGLQYALGREGYEVVVARDGAEALQRLRTTAADLVLLDVMLPGQSGLELCRDFRAASAVPIIMLTAMGQLADKVTGLELGADDYIVKPFGIRALVARIKAVGRRAVATPAESVAVQPIGPITIDRRQQKVFVSDEEIHLTPKEFDLLAYLASDPGAVFRRKDIMSEVWGTDWYGTTKTVDAHVASLRKKLGKQEWVEAVRGVGFRLDVPES